ncbi:MAG: metal-dependent hydrolase [Firmicutes bacterium]|nr:metal-dependent hydrolase [Bacillota bacterium]
MAKLRFLGHSCFLLSDEGGSVLIDPFLDGNPKAAVGPDDVNPQVILVTHAHGDHLGDTVRIAKRTGALCISTNEIAVDLQGKGLNTHPMHLGGTKNLEFGSVRVTPAFHGSGIAGGHACGFVVNLRGKRIYHAGDTCLFGDMKLIGERDPLDVALLPIGGNFTMDAEDAVRATGLLGARCVVPMHYGTFPPIETDPESFRRQVEQVLGISCRVLAPGQEMEI